MRVASNEMARKYSHNFEHINGISLTISAEGLRMNGIQIIEILEKVKRKSIACFSPTARA